MTETILILNAGSSSVKFQLFANTEALPRLAIGSVTGIGTNPVMVASRDGTDEKLNVTLPHDALQKDAVREIINWVENLDGGGKIVTVAHRFVHGGSLYGDPVVINAKVFHNLKALIPLAPLHQQHHLAAVGIVSRFLPGVPQIACFDTAFHIGREPIYANFAIPRKITSKGVHRYGFHGLSYHWSAQVLKHDYPDLAAGKVVVAHLGNGASLCAIKDGKSVDTTLGMSVLDGLPMGTRSGAIDAGAVFYMIREMKMGVDQVERMLYTESGLKGMSGISNDLRDLESSSDPRAKYALDYFILAIAKYIAAMAVSLGGIDGLVFTGGIGEHSKVVREGVLERLKFMNIPRVLIIPANEERLMAEQALDCMKKRSGK